MNSSTSPFGHPSPSPTPPPTTTTTTNVRLPTPPSSPSKPPTTRHRPPILFSRRPSEPKTSIRGKSRYIGSLVAQAQLRKVERNRWLERKRKKELGDIQGVERIVTEGYRRSKMGTVENGSDFSKNGRRDNKWRGGRSAGRDGLKAGLNVGVKRKRWEGKDERKDGSSGVVAGSGSERSVNNEEVRKCKKKRVGERRNNEKMIEAARQRYFERVRMRKQGEVR